jgi:tight adherence protein C
MLAEVSLGRSRREAMRAMSERSGSGDLQTFIAAILQADQMGVNIATALRVQADAMRVRRRQRAEELIAKAPVKMLFPLVSFIFPALFIVLLGPALMKIYAMFTTVAR